MNNHTIRYLLLTLIASFVCLNVGAVLPENDLDKTVVLLSSELGTINGQLEKERGNSESRRKNFWDKISDFEEKISIAQMVLLSQNSDNPLGMAKATQHAHQLLDDINDFRKPLGTWSDNLSDKIARTRGIRSQLMAIDTLRLSPNARAYRHKALTRCDSIEQFYTQYQKSVAGDTERYRKFEKQVSSLAKTNKETRNKLYTSIFVNNDDDILDLFDDGMKDVSVTSQAIKAEDASFDSEWVSTPQIIDEIDSLTFNLSVIISILAFVLISVLRRRHKQSTIYRYRGPISLLTFFVINIISDAFTILFISAPAHVIREVVFDMQLGVLISLIIVNTVLRRDKFKLRYVVFVNLPILCTSFLALNIVNGITPILGLVASMLLVLTVFVIVQLVVNIVFRKRLARADKIVAWINLAVLFTSLVVLCSGWTIISIMVTLTYISLMLLLLMFNICQRYMRLKVDITQHPILRYSLKTALYPLLVIGALYASAYWVAEIFDINTWLSQWLRTPFVNIPDLCCISAGRLIMITILGILVNYFVGLARRLFLTPGADRYALGKKAVCISLCSILVWLIYAIVVAVILQINHTGIIAAIGGASVGLGFALRDTIENFFYGITMMTGRARPGDIVECDGMRGIVRQVGIISTSVETEDGPIISLPNRQLFGRNFKNMTVNKSQELRHIAIDIDAKNDIDKARSIMLSCFNGIEGVIADGDHYVIMRHCGSGVVRMELKVWIDSRKYLRAEPAVREALFHAFENNGIKMSNVFKDIEIRTTDSLMTNPSTGLPFIPNT